MSREFLSHFWIVILEQTCNHVTGGGPGRDPKEILLNMDFSVARESGLKSAQLSVSWQAQPSELCCPNHKMIYSVNSALACLRMVNSSRSRSPRR